MEKIGIIFRGLKRSWRQSLITQLNAINKYYLDKISDGLISLDLIFLHYAFDDVAEFNKFINDLNLNYKIYNHMIEPPHFAIGGYLTLGYCSWRGSQIKQKIEYENNFFYDRIIETRYDIVHFEDEAWEHMNEFETKELHVYFNKKFYTDETHLPIVLNDFNVVTSGFTYDILGYSYMRNLDIIDKLKKFPDRMNDNFGAGEGWGIQLRKSGLIPDAHECMPPCLVRQEMYEFDLVLYAQDANSSMLPVQDLNSFITDTVERHNRIIPKFMLHIFGFYVSNFAKTTLIVPEITDDLRSFIKCADLEAHIELTTEYTITKQVALFNTDEIMSLQLFKIPLRFRPPNNFIMPAKLTTIKLGYDGPVHDMGHTQHNPFVVFDNSITRYDPSVNNLTNSGNMFVYEPIDETPLNIESINQVYRKYYDNETGVIEYTNKVIEPIVSDSVLLWVFNSRFIIKCANDEIHDGIIEALQVHRNKALILYDNNNYIGILYNKDVLVDINRIVDSYR